MSNLFFMQGDVDLLSLGWMHICATLLVLLISVGLLSLLVPVDGAGVSSCCQVSQIPENRTLQSN